MANQNLWSKEELLITFNLYLKTPFGKMHSKNKDVVKLAEIIGRTPSSIALRLVNYASVDPALQARGIKGMKGGTSVVQPIWNEYFNNQEELIFQSEKILAEKQQITIETKYKDILRDISHLKGETIIREVKTRVNQSVFRKIVLANYNIKCAVTGIDIPELLYASHILPWSTNEKERLNPENGICLSATFDKAFDKGLIGISSDLTILFSEKLKVNSKKTYFDNQFKKYEGQKISIPEKYIPKKDFLEYHLDVIFNN